MKDDNNEDKADDLVSYQTRAITRPHLTDKPSAFDVRGRRNSNVESKSNMSSFWNSSRPQDFLTEFLLQIFIERGIGPQQLNQYITQYMREARKRAPYKTNKDITSIRGNVVKELNRGSMPFRNFMGKLRMVRIRDMEFTLTLTDSTGHTTTHTKRCRDSTVRVEEPDISLDNELD